MLRWLLQLKRLVVLLCSTLRGMQGTKLELDQVGTLIRVLLFLTGDVTVWRLDARNCPTEAESALRRKALSQLASNVLKHMTSHGALLTALGVRESV